MSGRVLCECQLRGTTLEEKAKYGLISARTGIFRRNAFGLKKARAFLPQINFEKTTATSGSAYLCVRTVLTRSDDVTTSTAYLGTVLNLCARWWMANMNVVNSTYERAIASGFLTFAFTLTDSGDFSPCAGDNKGSKVEEVSLRFA